MNLKYSFFEKETSYINIEYVNSLSNTLFIGKVLLNLDRIGSTNQYALDLLAQKPAEGTIISTDNQFAGRGQMTKIWESAPSKNLTISIILYPSFLLAKDQFLLSQIVAISIAETLQSFLPSGVKIKWPNDLYVNDKKITGILIQNALKGSRIQSSVIGIGQNVNQAIFLSDAPNPTSLFIEKGQEIPREIVLTKLCQQLEQWYLQLKAGKVGLIKKTYLDLLYRKEEIHVFRRADKSTFQGKIIGITEIGQLKVETDNGVEVFNLKEIQYMI